MIEIYDLHKGSAVDFPAEPLSLALGNFDGVHLGHRALFNIAVDTANELECASAALTFDRNPSGAPELTSKAEKLALFAAAGIDYAVVCSFDSIRTLEAAEFVQSILLGRLGVKAAVCGFNHRFGSKGAGNPELLSKILASAGGVCRTVAPVLYGGEPISSSRIRQAIAEGHIAQANEMLGYPYSVTAEVTHGRKLGRELGFPTVNQLLEKGRALPRFGVYVCRCLGHAAVCNIGVRPTVTDSPEVVCETYIIGFEGDLYGRRLSVELLDFLRPEQKFDSIEELRSRLEQDVALAAKMQS